MIKIGKKKTKDESKSLYYSWKGIAIALGVIIIVGLLNSFLSKPEFHSETDVCLQNCSDRAWFYAPKDWSRYCLIAVPCEEYHILKDTGETCYQYDKDSCWNWRPKTFCELCLDNWTAECDERCECDEWTERKVNTHTGEIICPAHIERRCIKAHEKTECQKGNPSYIYAKEKLEIFNPVIDKTDIIDGCMECRKKTLSDLNCAELRDYFENGRQCKYFSGKCKYPQTIGSISTRYDKERALLYQMILKDCSEAKP